MWKSKMKQELVILFPKNYMKNDLGNPYELLFCQVEGK